MAISKAKKEGMVEGYEQGLGTSQNAFLVGFDKITVAQVDDLRRRVRESGGHYEVVKNRLAKRAIEGTAFEGLGEHFSGPTAVAYSDDAVGLAKALTDFAKEEPVLEFKAGLVEGQEVSADDIKDIANLPSR
ncbi:MAG: 50S ribosomal protein L10, partial [Acidobacteriota bacterium]